MAAAPKSVTANVTRTNTNKIKEKKTRKKFSSIGTYSPAKEETIAATTPKDKPSTIKSTINTRPIIVKKPVKGKKIRLPSDRNTFMRNFSVCSFIDRLMMPNDPPNTKICKESAAMTENSMPISTKIARPKYSKIILDNI